MIFSHGYILYHNCKSVVVLPQFDHCEDLMQKMLKDAFLHAFDLIISIIYIQFSLLNALKHSYPDSRE